MINTIDIINCMMLMIIAIIISSLALFDVFVEISGIGCVCVCCISEISVPWPSSVLLDTVIC